MPIILRSAFKKFHSKVHFVEFAIICQVAFLPAVSSWWSLKRYHICQSSGQIRVIFSRQPKLSETHNSTVVIDGHFFSLSNLLHLYSNLSFFYFICSISILHTTLLQLLNHKTDVRPLAISFSFLFRPACFAFDALSPFQANCLIN